MGGPGFGEVVTIILVALVPAALVIGVVVAFVRAASKKSDHD